MPLSVKDGMGAWVKDFQDSNAPQFKGKSDKERREMAIAAYLSAKRGDTNEALLPTKDVEKVIGKGAKPIKNVKNSDGTKQTPMSRAKTLAKKARDAQKDESVEENNNAREAGVIRRHIARKKNAPQTPAGREAMVTRYFMRKKAKEQEQDKNKGKTSRPPTNNESVEINEREDTAHHVAKTLIKMGVRHDTPEHEVLKKIPHALKKHGLAGNKNIQMDRDFHGDVFDSLDSLHKKVDEIFAVKPSPTQIFHRKVAKQTKKRGPMTPPKKDPNSPQAQAAKREADRMKALGRGPGFDESTNLGEAKDMYQSAAQELKSYATKSGGMDKKDFHIAAKHIENIGRAGIIRKGQHLAKLSKHLRDLDTSPREKVLSVLHKHGHEVGDYMPGVKMKRRADEAVQVDELKKTLHSYIPKAAQSAAGLAYSAAQKSMSNPDQSGKDYVKSVKRQKGIAKATDRLAREAKLDEVSAKKLTNYIGLSKDEKGNIQKTGASGSLEKSLKKSTDAFRSGDKEARRAATKTANKRAKGLQMARAKLDKKAGARFSVAKVPATEAKSFDQQFSDKLRFSLSKSPAVRAYLKKSRAEKDAAHAKQDPKAVKLNYGRGVLVPGRAYNAATKRGMSPRDAADAVSTTFGNRRKNGKLPG